MPQFQDLVNAIRERKIISFTYSEEKIKIRPVVCPTKIGVLTTGNNAIEGYWIGGDSASKKLPPWRLYLINNISDLKIMDKTFSNVGKEYTPADKRFSRILEYVY